VTLYDDARQLLIGTPVKQRDYLSRILSKRNPDGTTYAGVSPYAGKKWAALGTSITLLDPNGYVGPLATMLGATLVNLGTGGASLTQVAPGDGVIGTEAASVPADASLITVEAGVNDFMMSLPLGAPGDYGAAVSFYGALDILLWTLTQGHPTADVAVLTPYTHLTYPVAGLSGNWYTPNNAGDRMPDFWAAIHDVCGYYSVPVIKVGEESGVGG
jgi:hypothetical protein